MNTTRRACIIDALEPLPSSLVPYFTFPNPFPIPYYDLEKVSIETKEGGAAFEASGEELTKKPVEKRDVETNENNTFFISIIKVFGLLI